MLFKDQSKAIIDQTITELKQINATKENAVKIKLLDFYEGYQEQYLFDYGFYDIERKVWKTPPTHVNFTKKVINKVSLLYKKPPDRILSINDKPIPKEEDKFDQWISYGDGQYNIHFKWAERYKKLTHSILFRPVYNTIEKRWKYFIDTTFEPHFYSSDPLHPFGYSIKIGKNDDGEVWVFWSDKEYFFHDNNYKKWTKQTISDGTTVDFKGENPFEILPLVEFRLAPPITQWYSPGATDLVNCNHSINVKLMELNMGIRYQSFGIPWENSGADAKEVGNIIIGPDVIAHLPKDATLQSLNLDPKFMEIMQSIKDQVDMINRAYNININWNLQGSPASGFSLMVQNIDLMEDREDDIDMAVTAEKQMYKIIAKMQQFYKKTGQLDPKEPILPEGAELSIDYAEIDFPINQTEELAFRDWNIKYNIKTPLDYMDPELTDDEKLYEYTKNKKINGQLTQEEQLAAELEAEGITIGGNGEL